MVKTKFIADLENFVIDNILSKKSSAHFNFDEIAYNVIACTLTGKLKFDTETATPSLT